MKPKTRDGSTQTSETCWCHCHSQHSYSTSTERKRESNADEEETNKKAKTADGASQENSSNGEGDNLDNILVCFLQTISKIPEILERILNHLEAPDIAHLATTCWPINQFIMTKCEPGNGRVYKILSEKATRRALTNSAFGTYTFQYDTESESFYCMGMDEHVFITDRPGRLIICELSDHEMLPMHGWGAPGLILTNDSQSVFCIENELITGGPFIVQPVELLKAFLMGRNWCFEVDLESKVIIGDVNDAFKINVNLRAAVPHCKPVILHPENRFVTIIGDLSEGTKQYRLPQSNGEAWSVTQCEEMAEFLYVTDTTIFLFNPYEDGMIKWQFDLKAIEPYDLELSASYLTPILCGCAYWSRSPDNEDGENLGVLHYLIVDTKTGQLLHHGTGGLDWDIVHEQDYETARPIFAVAKGPFLCLSHDIGTMEILMVKVGDDKPDEELPGVKVRRFELPISTFFPHLSGSDRGFWLHDSEFDGEVGVGEPHRYYYFYKMNRVTNLFGIVQGNVLMGTLVHDRTNFDPDDDNGIVGNDLKILSDETAFCVDLDKALEMYSPAGAEAAVWTPLENKEKTYLGQKYVSKRNSHWPHYMSDIDKGKVTLMGLLERPWFPRYTLRTCIYEKSFNSSVAVPPTAAGFIR